MTDESDPSPAEAGDLSPRDAAVLAAARDALVARPAPAPAGLVDTAMQLVTVDLRPARRLALPTADLTAAGDAAFVTDTAAANALRLSLDGEFGDSGTATVVARRCRVEADGGGWRVGLSVAVSYAYYDRHGDSAIRSRVVAVAAALFGVVVTAVDIDVVDVFTGFTAHPTRGGS